MRYVTFLDPRAEALIPHRNIDSDYIARMMLNNRNANQAEAGMRIQASGCLQFEHEIVRIAVIPAFSCLERTNHRMLRRALMPGRMFTNRGVAATHVPAMHTQPQMNPALMQLQALLAAFGVGFYWFDGVEMSTLVGHTSRPFHIFLLTAQMRASALSIPSIQSLQG